MTIEQAESLISSKYFQQLKYFQEKTNVFTVVGQTHTEHWHSSFMGWLLDPNSSLCLGHYPLVRLLSLYMIKSEHADLSLKEVFEMHLDTMHFETEKTFFTADGKKRSIDVYGESNELILVIENKVKARENMNGTTVGQTKDYRDYVETHKQSGQKVIYLFITPDPKQKPYDKNYVKITYQEFYDYVIAKCIEHPQIHKEGLYLLEQYANNLREPVHGSPMALVNTVLCNDIYDSYSDILDEIFHDVEKSTDYLNDDTLSCIVYKHYQSIFDEIYLSLDEKHYGKTPKSKIQRKFVSFTDLYRAKKIQNGTEFIMEYDGVYFYAIAEYDSEAKECYMLLLDENKRPYYNQKGEKIGFYKASSQAGLDAINLYRKRHQIDKKITTLNGPAYWKTKEGVPIKTLIDSL
ncbi:MAG: PD-(D/E)XK nuclease family protein [bacterium]|nr:PD-(D/E)XK nuclease family protein [bacterium]